MLARLLQAKNPKLAYERERLVLASTADGAGGATNPCVRHWLRYCIWGWRPAGVTTAVAGGCDHRRVWRA